MHLNGDLGHFHPADILMFLSQLKLSGLLAVTGAAGNLSLVISNGVVTDGHCEQADDKLLRMLVFFNHVDPSRYQELARIRLETGMPVRQILDTLGLLATPGIRDVLEAGVREVLFAFFSMEKGSYRFTDVAVEPDAAGIELGGRRICLEISRLVDEFRDIERNWGSLDRDVEQTPAGLAGRARSLQENTVLRMASGGKTIRQIVRQAPFPSYQALKAANDLLARQWLKVGPAPADGDRAAAESPSDGLFFAFKRAFKRLLTATQLKEKVAALSAFCKHGCEQMAIITSREGEIVQCIAVVREQNGAVSQKTLSLPGMRLDQDPLIGSVQRCGIGFFGQAFSSRLIEAVLGPISAGRCAVVPVSGDGGDLSVMLYAHSGKQSTGISPFHYLELLSWLCAGDRPVMAKVPEHAANGPVETAVQPPFPAIVGFCVNAIDDLPPLPAVVSRALKLLADPNSSMRELEILVGQDQALTARLIKIGNSALFGGLQKVASLRQALARLGTRTVKGLVLAAATGNLFPREKSVIGIASQLLWRHAVECGLAARRLAIRAGFADPEEMFAGGVLHDIGKLVILLKFTDQYQAIERLCKTEAITDLEAETRVLGYDHARIGDMLMEKWKMPEALCACVRHHHDADNADAGMRMVSLVACGNHLSHLLGTTNGGDPHWRQAKIGPLLAQIGIGGDVLETLREDLLADFQDHELFT